MRHITNLMKCWWGVIFLLLLSGKSIEFNCPNYDYELINYSSPFDWKEVAVKSHHNNVKNCELLQFPSDLLSHLQQNNWNSTSFVSIPVYVSLTTIASRINFVNNTIISILYGLIRPTNIYLFVSTEAYLLDKGVSTIPQSLLALASLNLLTIVFTKNVGPHRKLLPILHRFWDNNCILITVDDDMGFARNSSIVYQLLRQFVQSEGNAVIALRARRFGLCNTPPFEVTRYNHWLVYVSQSGRREMLLLPTGTGGVLYRPQFFHEIVFDRKLRDLTGTADDLMFRLACLAKNVSVVVACRDLRFGKRTRKCSTDITYFQEHPSETAEKVINHSTTIIPTLGRDELEQLRYWRRYLRSRNQTTSGSYSIRYRNSSSSSSSSRNRSQEKDSLFDINRHSKNDRQFRAAQKYLKVNGILFAFFHHT